MAGYGISGNLNGNCVQFLGYVDPVTEDNQLTEDTWIKAISIFLDARWLIGLMIP